MSQRGWAPGPRLSSPGERERHKANGHKSGGNILQFYSVSNSLSHANLTIKRVVYFCKEVFARFYSLCRCVLHESACTCKNAYVLCVCIVNHGYIYYVAV